MTFDPILLTALVVVVLIGLPVAVGVGYLASRRSKATAGGQQNPGATQQPPPNNPGGAQTTPPQTPQPPPAQPTVAPARTPSAFWTWVWPIVAIFTFALLLLGGYYLLTTPGVLLEERAIIVGLPQLSELSFPEWKTAYGLIAATIFFFLFLILPKKPEWMKPFFLILAVLTLLLTLTFSGFGERFVRDIERTEECAATGDCGPTLSDIRVIKGGTVKVPRSGSVTVKVVGHAVFEGNINEGLDFSGSSLCEIEWIEGTNLFKFTPDGGTRTLTVSSIPAERYETSVPEDCDE